MQHHFSQFGIIEEVFSDNASCSLSAEYMQFTAAWDFKRITLSPLHPQSNGLLEKP